MEQANVIVSPLRRSVPKDVKVPSSKVDKRYGGENHFVGGKTGCVEIGQFLRY